jgi:hypothetical protein
MSSNPFTCNTCPMNDMLRSDPTLTTSQSVQRLLGQINLLDRTTDVYRAEHRVLKGDEKQAADENFNEELAESVFPELVLIIADTTENGRDEDGHDMSVDNGISIQQCAKRILDKVCIKTQL